MLTLEFIDGIELHDIARLKKDKYEIGQVMTNGVNALLEQVFVHGIFHGDPHPGNIFVLKNNSIALIDFGIVGYFDQKLKERMIDLRHAIVEHDEETILSCFTALVWKVRRLTMKRSRMR